MSLNSLNLDVGCILLALAYIIHLSDSVSMASQLLAWMLVGYSLMSLYAYLKGRKVDRKEKEI